MMEFKKTQLDTLAHFFKLHIPGIIDNRAWVNRNKELLKEVKIDVGYVIITGNIKK